MPASRSDRLHVRSLARSLSSTEIFVQNVARSFTLFDHDTFFSTLIRMIDAYASARRRGKD